MGKVQLRPRSPKCGISLDRTPTLVVGKLELFGNITDMICQWEGMEGEEVRAGDHLLDKRGRKKRMSKVIRKISGRFEEGDGDHKSQTGGKGSGERENISHTISFSNLEEGNKRKMNNIISNSIRISTDRKSRKNGAERRKRKAFWREDNPVTKKSKLDEVQLG
jgi:hypothetical protein